MGEKDITEKLLEDYNDVFADIVNVLMFQGKQIVSPAALTDTKLRSQYKADDSRLHEMERDVAKNWTQEDVVIALYGIENQTKPEKIMPIRVFGYEGNSYRTQLLKTEAEKGLYPVVTIVLHFGKNRWNQPKHLKQVIPIPNILDEYVNDFKIHVFEIAWLTDEQVAMFKSDFRIVAEYFTQMRKNNKYEPSAHEIQHVDEVLKLLSVFGGEPILEEIVKKKEGENTMYGYITKYCEETIATGIADGVAKELPKAVEREVAKEVAKEVLSKTDALQKRLNLSLDSVLAAMDMTMEEYENLKNLTESKE